MNSWSGSPFPPDVRLSDVPQGAVLARDRGESRVVFEIAGHPGWLAKLYRSPLGVVDAARLKALTLLPATLTDPAQTDVVDRCTCWPVSRVLDERGTVVGVVVAKAPRRFFAALRGLSGRPTRPAPLEIDWLVREPEAYGPRGLAVPDLGVRVTAARQLVAFCALLEQWDVVYGDWSYSNVFWARNSGDVFVIDLDTCGIERREWIESPEWEDPLFPNDSQPPLTVHCDRFKLATLLVRCLTGVRRDPRTAYAALPDALREGRFGAVLDRILAADTPGERPGPDELSAALEEDVAALDLPVRIVTEEPDELEEPEGREPEPDESAGSDAAAEPASARTGNVTGHIPLTANGSAPLPRPPAVPPPPASPPPPSPAAPHSPPHTPPRPVVPPPPTAPPTRAAGAGTIPPPPNTPPPASQDVPMPPPPRTPPPAHRPPAPAVAPPPVPSPPKTPPPPTTAPPTAAAPPPATAPPPAAPPPMPPPPSESPPRSPLPPPPPPAVPPPPAAVPPPPPAVPPPSAVPPRPQSAPPRT
ncbi:hypothetical protein [Yinghuangia seranimata]|uniref:hypothetical protein n=1 Tax=Yinghuangia seranimata TaxID=408067 RepID=UPI00248C880F|nr:hypothetical protein [Yinghuangia seranimata]MDI2129826.1 hypothetical protein [Yinghuangia seranimata]